MTKYLQIISITLILAVAGCGGEPTKKTAKPDWVDGQSTKYPSSQYLIGRGSYKYVDGAKDRARADLAKNFEVSIRENASDVQAFHKKSEGGVSEQSSEQSLERTITTSTDQIVRGVQVVDVWQDPQSSQFYALAILSRFQAAEGLRQEIGRLDETTKINIESASNTGDKLDKIAYAGRALEAQIERVAFQRTLQVVDLTGRGVQPVWQVAKLKADYEKLLKRIRIRPLVLSDNSNSLQQALSGGIADAGFVVVNDNTDIDYTLEANLRVDDLGKKEGGWYWSRGILEIILVDSSQSVRGKKRWSLKASAQDQVVVYQRIGDEVNKVLGKDLRSTIIDFAKSSDVKK